MPGIKKPIRVLFLFFTLISCIQLYCESELSQLDCGIINGEFYYYINLFSGWGGGFSQSSQFRENPALLKGFERSEYNLRLAPEISLNLGSLYSNYNEALNVELDGMIAGVKSDTLNIGYPDLGVKLQQSGGVRDMTIQMPSGASGCWGISLWRPLAIGGDITGNSLLMTMQTDAGIGKEEETKIVLGNDFRLGLGIELNQTRLGYAWRLKNGIQLGGGIDILYLSIGGDAYSRTEGFIRQYGGDTDITQAFNDPIDSQYYRNTLDNTWQVDYEELLTGFTAGMSYQISEQALIDLGISQPYQQELSGSSEGIVRSLGAVDYDALIGESEGELFDELLLEPSKLTYTNETIYSCRSLVFSYPGMIRLGLSIEKGRTRHQFIMATYLGELSLRYKGDVSETGREKVGNNFEPYVRSREVDYTYGIRIKSKLEYNLQHKLSSRLGMYLTLQYYTLEEVMDNIKDNDGELVEPDTMISLVAGNMGLSYQFSDKLMAECLLMGFPGPWLEMSISYRFGNNK